MVGKRIFLSLLGIALVTTASASQDAERIFASSERAVFTIETPTKVGTGFVLGGDLLVTCYHVVKGSGGRIKLREYPSVRASYLTHNEKADIAVYKLDSAMPSSLRVGVSTPNIGSTVYVIGTPLGSLERSISNGIISQVRIMRGFEFLQLTAAISPGSSGSPVFDSNGLVVGMVNGTMKEDQSNNFAVSCRALNKFLSSEHSAKVETSRIARPPAKLLKTSGLVTTCQFVRSSACYPEPNITSEPVGYVRAKRITLCHRTVSPEWVTIKLTNGDAVYVPAKDVKLVNPKDKNSQNFRDPLNVSPPRGFEKLLSEINSLDLDKYPSSDTKLLSYGPGIVKHVLARFEFSYDFKADLALLALDRLGMAAKPALLTFLFEGSETQKEAIARLIGNMADTLDDAERTVRDALTDDTLSGVYREMASEDIKRLSWIRDSDMQKRYSILLASKRARHYAVKIIGFLGIKTYKNQVIDVTRSKDYYEAESGFEAFCKLADENDK